MWTNIRIFFYFSAPYSSSSDLLFVFLLFLLLLLLLFLSYFLLSLSSRSFLWVFILPLLLLPKFLLLKCIYLFIISEIYRFFFLNTFLGTYHRPENFEKRWDTHTAEWWMKLVCFVFSIQMQRPLYDRASCAGNTESIDIGQRWRSPCRMMSSSECR